MAESDSNIYFKIYADRFKKKGDSSFSNENYIRVRNLDFAKFCHLCWATNFVSLFSRPALIMNIRFSGMMATYPFGIDSRLAIIELETTFCPPAYVNMC